MFSKKTLETIEKVLYTQKVKKNAEIESLNMGVVNISDPVERQETLDLIEVLEEQVQEIEKALDEIKRANSTSPFSLEDLDKIETPNQEEGEDHPEGYNRGCITPDSTAQPFEPGPRAPDQPPKRKKTR